jgi:hypothetical protein
LILKVDTPSDDKPSIAAGDEEDEGYEVPQPVLEEVIKEEAEENAKVNELLGCDVKHAEETEKDAAELQQAVEAKESS